MIRIKKVIFPIAGKGTRVAPISDYIPKEMLPVLDKPLIHYSIVEALEAGITEFIMVVRQGKETVIRYIENEFFSRNCRFTYVFQKQQNGLGDAILCAEHLIDEDDVFAVMLPDDLMLNSNCLLEMVKHYSGGNMVATKLVEKDAASLYGILKTLEREADVISAAGIVEKPENVVDKNNYAVVGRYLLDGQVMDSLKRINSGASGEVQLSDAITHMVDSGYTLYGYEFSGESIDCGSKVGWISAILKMARNNKEFSSIFSIGD